MSKTELEIIGNNALVDIGGHKHVPAKIDTGADSSAIWASQIEVDKKGVLSFVLFDKKSPFYTGKRIERKQFNKVDVRSSNGHLQNRFQILLPVTINGRKIRATFTLADRSRNIFPVLIGRRALRNKFLVDVSQGTIPRIDKNTDKDTSSDSKARTTNFLQSAKTAFAAKTALAPKTNAEITPIQSAVTGSKMTPQLQSKPRKQPSSSAPKQSQASSSAQSKAKSTPTTASVQKSRNYEIFIKQALSRNNYAAVITDKTRRLYFGKYDHSFALANTLWSIYRLKTLRDADLSAEFTKVYPLLKLRRFVDRLLTDPKAIVNLSNYAVNLICLSEILFPHKSDRTYKLARLALNSKPDRNPVDYITLCLQIIVADSHYFSRSVSDRHKLILRQLLRRASTYIESFYENAPRSVLYKFIACARLVGQEKKYATLIRRIMTNATQTGKHSQSSTAAQPARAQRPAARGQK